MESQHYNKLESALWFVEKLVREIEGSMERKDGIYASFEIDLDEERIKAVRKLLKDIYAGLEEAKRTFGLESKQVKLSRLIETNTSFIWETIEKTWSSRMEKTSGKSISESDKQEIDKALRKILDLSNKLGRVTRDVT